MKYSISVVALFVVGILASPASAAPKCPSDQQYNSCGTACPKTCTTTGPVVCTTQCVPGCFCKTGTVLNQQTGKCVKPSQC